MKLHLIMVIFCIFATACRAKIEGKVIDNFGKVLSNVKVKINNSSYESFSKHDGSFEITYSSGKIEIIFEKENYLYKKMKIIDAKDYHTGTIRMTRIPDSIGVFIKGSEDYIRFKEIELIEVKGKCKNKMMPSNKKLNYYLKADENIPEIELKETKVEIYDNVLNHFYLFKTKNKEVVKTVLGFYGSSFSNDNLIEQKLIAINNVLNKREFQIEEEGTYVLIRVKGNEFFSFLSREAYAFKIIK